MENKKEICRIADIEFIFDNSSMLTLLEKRANALKSAKFEKAAQIEDQLTKQKNKDFDNITRPRLFYVTFKYEEAHDALLKRGFIEFMGQKIPTL